MSRLDDFVGRLEAALSDEGREAFVEYLQWMTPGERAELLDEAGRRDPEGAAEVARGVLNQTEAGRPPRGTAQPSRRLRKVIE